MHNCHGIDYQGFPCPNPVEYDTVTVNGLTSVVYKQYCEHCREINEIREADTESALNRLEEESIPSSPYDQ